MSVTKLKNILSKYEKEFCDLCSPKSSCKTPNQKKPIGKIIEFDEVAKVYFSHVSMRPASCDGLKIDNSVVLFELKMDVFFKNSIRELHKEFSKKIKDSIKVLKEIEQKENIFLQNIISSEIKYFIVPNMITSGFKKLKISKDIIRFENSYTNNQNYRALYSINGMPPVKFFVKNCDDLVSVL